MSSQRIPLTTPAIRPAINRMRRFHRNFDEVSILWRFGLRNKLSVTTMDNTIRCLPVWVAD
jgi:hypothetical protein